MVALLNQPLSIAALATLFAQVQGSSALLSRRSANPSVTLDNGLSVQGSISSSTPNVAQFLGIPYAQPPLNDLRWAPPQPYVATNGTVINGTALPPSCMQYITDLDTMITQDTPQFVIGSAGISEDCLTASVWAPSTAPASKNESLPVLIWFFGGGFTTGGVDVPYQIPAQWIERSQEHIVVAFNYRLNIFGFPNSPALDQQNLGLLDQRLAVEWVQANIASFGGDASRMVIWGHSAGSEAVDFYNYAWSADPIVKGLIMDSGTAHLEILKSSDTIQSNFSFVASNVGCANQTSSEAELACMRKLPASTIEDFVHSYQDSGASPSIGFSPIADEQIVFSNYTEQGLIGAISDIPAIIGFNGDEGVFLSPYSPTGVNETIATSLSYSVFWCPATKTSAERVAANVTTHRFFYKGNFTNVSPKPWLGAYHGSELPQIFGTAANFNGNSTAFETEVSHAMQDAYVLFASNPETGLESIGWPAYKGAGGDVRVFAEDGVVSQTQSVVAIEEECATLGLL